jgi:DNA-binding FrmR family transcriptional regulator
MPPNRRLDPLRRPLAGDSLADMKNRLKTARGHIDHIVTLLDEQAYVIEVLRQVAAVRGALDATVRVALRYYFENTFVNAVQAGQSAHAIDEMMRALTFLRQLD